MAIESNIIQENIYKYLNVLIIAPSGKATDYYDVFSSFCGDVQWEDPGKRAKRLLLENPRFYLAFVDIECVDFIHDIKSIRPNMNIFIVTDAQRSNLAVKAQNGIYGVYFYLIIKQSKDLWEKIDHLKCSIASMIHNKCYSSQMDKKFNDYKTKSNNFKEIKKAFKKSKEKNLTILLKGQEGSGKDVLARMLHSYHIHFKENIPFVICSCKSLVDEEFNNMVSHSTSLPFNKGLLKNYFIKASGGVLHISDVEILPELLKKDLILLLKEGRFIDHHGIYRNKDFHLVLSCRDIASNDFLNDIEPFARYTIFVEPLTERKFDIDFIGKYLLEKYRNQYDRNVFEINQNALELIQRYNFPSNLHALNEIISSALLFCETSQITKSDIIKAINRYELKRRELKEFVDIRNDFIQKEWNSISSTDLSEESFKDVVFGGIKQMFSILTKPNISIIHLNKSIDKLPIKEGQELLQKMIEYMSESDNQSP